MIFTRRYWTPNFIETRSKDFILKLLPGSFTFKGESPIIRLMKNILVLLVLSFASHSFAGNAYPRGPDVNLTPGSLCNSPTAHRYPEQIPYCERDVNSATKELVFINYRKLGYSLSGDRGQYKVDHYIPLCAGGSNNENNLWPQYHTISERTDMIEMRGCEVLALGKITQKELVGLVMKAKLDLSEAPTVLKYLNKLRGNTNRQ